MRIYLDDLVFSLQKIGGISVYWSSFLEKVDRSDYEVCLISVGASDNILSGFKWHKKVESDLKIPVSLLRILPLLKRLSPKSIFHSSYLRVSLQRSVCNLVTVHDLAAEDRMINGVRRYLKLWLQSFAIKKADGIICVSESTRRSLLSHYPNLKQDRVKTIYHGCSSKFSPSAIKHPTDQKILLFVGGRGVYKNFSACIEVMKILEDYQLVMVGGGKLSLSEKSHIDMLFPRRYTHFEQLDTVSLNTYYNKAHCLFYPTVYEGFGLPILEAMNAGCPVVSSNIPAISEIAQNAALLVNDPKDYLAFAKAITSLEDDNVRASLINEGLKRAKCFSLENQFTETMVFYEKIYRAKFNL
ncbi:MAG TPA: glycosyltransferase family 1 protein [Pelobium sp.]|nr:glycosyltransferase family 1 protein [Pelobium sp.]